MDEAEIIHHREEVRKAAVLISHVRKEWSVSDRDLDQYLLSLAPVPFPGVQGIGNTPVFSAATARNWTNLPSDRPRS